MGDEGPRIELFHAVADPASAAVRRFVVAHDLSSRVRFRNVTYPEVRADLFARGGHDAPAVWDGQHLAQGEAACLARLALVASGP